MEKRAPISTSSNRPAPSARPSKQGSKKPKDARSRILGLAMGAGALASLLAYFWLQNQSNPRNNRAAASVSVLTAMRDIPARTMITKDMVQVRLIPADQAKAGALSDPAPVIGKVTTVSIANGHPVTLQAVAPPDINMGMAFTLPSNYRAVSVSLDPVSAVAGFIKPGDRVDVLATFKGDAGSQSVTCVVLQNVPLLATGSKALPGYTPPQAPKPVEGTSTTTTDGGPGTSDNGTAKPEEVPTATLMVSPKEAQTLILASSSGKIQLTLRSPNDKEQPALAELSSSFFTKGKGKQESIVQTPKPVAAPKNPPAAKIAASANQKPKVVKAASSKEAVKAIAPVPASTHPVKLDGVMLGDEGFAMVTSGKQVWYKKIGETISQYQIRKLTEDGMWVRTAKGREELWNVGDSRMVPE